MTLLVPPPAGGPVLPAGLSPHGDQLTADLNNLITNPISFLAAGIFARLRQASGTQTLTASATNVISYDTVDEDPYSGWSATATGTQAAHSWQPPAGCSGWYWVHVSVSLGTVPADSVLRPVVLVTGTPQFALETAKAPSAPMIISGSALVYMLGGADYVQGAVFFASGSGNEPTSIAAGYQSLMDVSWESN
jgi:hypothetical protein